MANDRSIAISKPSEDGKRPAESIVPAVSGVVPWVFIVNHHEPAREALRQLCTSVGLAVETYPTAEAFLAAFDGRRPGCLLLELCLPGMGGFGLQRELAARNLGLPVIVVTSYGDVRTAVDALKAGAFDYFEEPFSRQLLLDRIHQAIELDRATCQLEVQRAGLARRLALLTAREREVLDLVVDGHTNKQIAALLGIREKTVECHRANLMRKLSVESVAEMIRLVVTLDGDSMRRQRMHAWFVVLWIVASTTSFLSGVLDDLVSDLPELIAGLVSSLGMA